MNRILLSFLTFCMSLGIILGSDLIAPPDAAAQPVPECTVNSDCDDDNGCTSDTCIAGTCARVTCEQFNPQPQCKRFACSTGDSSTAGPSATCVVEADPNDNGLMCNDGNSCTLSDTCNAGVCAGSPVDCSGSADQCNTGVCDPADGLCDAVPVADATPCSDGLLCTENDACTSGVCDGTPVDCSGSADQCNTGVCDPADGLCDTVPVEDGTPCKDPDACTRFDSCYGGVCAGVDRCGDANVDGQKTVLDCLQIIVHGVAGTGECAPDSCDLDGDCKVSIIDALGCLHCTVGLPTCPNNCPTAVGFSEAWAPEVMDASTVFGSLGVSPLLESSIFGVDYSFAPGKFCKKGGEAVCQPLVNKVNPADALLSVVPEFLGTQIFPTLDMTALNPDPSGFYGPHFAQCYFWVDPLSPANPLDENDFQVIGGDLSAVGVPLGGGPPVPLNLQPELCPACGDGVCNPLDYEDPYTCQVDCGFAPF